MNPYLLERYFAPQRGEESNLSVRLNPTVLIQSPFNIAAKLKKEEEKSLPNTARLKLSVSPLSACASLFLSKEPLLNCEICKFLGRKKLPAFKVKDQFLKVVMSNEMPDKEFDKILLTRENKIFSIFTEFMSRISMLDELVDAGKSFLTRFNQKLVTGYFRRRQINKDLKIVIKVIKSNMTERMQSYFDAGCTHSYQNVQNLSQLHLCMLGLQDFLKKAQASLQEIECLADDEYKAVIEAEQNVSRSIQEHIDGTLMNQTTSPEDQAEPFDVKEKSVSYATIMTLIHHMLKLDYTMQEKIVGCLSLNTSLSELDTYCQMWDLRPYVDDDMMLFAWKSMS